MYSGPQDQADSELLEEWEVVPSPKRTIYPALRGRLFGSHPGPISSVTATKKCVFTIITTTFLIPGDGKPIPDAALVIDRKVIAWIGSQSDLPGKYKDAPHRAVSVPYLMPGLWDCHVHFAGVPDDAVSNAAFLLTHPAEAGARLTRGCWDALQWGYTSVRDLSGFGCEVARAVEDGTIIGPNIYSSGGGLSQTAGHGDFHDLPAGDVLGNIGVSKVTPGHFGTSATMVVDGKEECRRAVRLNIRRGARCIKVMASGGVGSLNDDLFCAQFSSEELECIVEEAARQNLIVAAHAHAKPGIMAAVRAGVKTIEHGSFADREVMDLMKKNDVVYVATRTITEILLSTGGEGLPTQVWEKTKMIGKANSEAYALAIRTGIKVALGTDMSPGFNAAKELEYAVEAGMSNLEAIKAATANGPLTVGPKAPKSGQLKVGYEADILGLLENPVEDVKVLQEIENVKWVWKAGKAFKGPGIGPWGE
ncbi:amidohydrolase [Thozetella sp. PMI_491]|nr:amidohydrolase [Thozetella sp. PMI_491]